MSTQAIQDLTNATTNLHTEFRTIIDNANVAIADAGEAAAQAAADIEAKWETERSRIHSEQLYRRIYVNVESGDDAGDGSSIESAVKSTGRFAHLVGTNRSPLQTHVEIFGSADFNLDQIIHFDSPVTIIDFAPTVTNFRVIKTQGHERIHRFGFNPTCHTAYVLGGWSHAGQSRIPLNIDSISPVYFLDHDSSHAFEANSLEGTASQQIIRVHGFDVHVGAGATFAAAGNGANGSYSRETSHLKMYRTNCTLSLEAGAVDLRFITDINPL